MVVDTACAAKARVGIHYKTLLVVVCVHFGRGADAGVDMEGRAKQEPSGVKKKT